MRKAHIIVITEFDYIILFPDNDILRIDHKRLESIEEKWEIIDISYYVNKLIEEK